MPKLCLQINAGRACLPVHVAGGAISAGTPDHAAPRCSTRSGSRHVVHARDDGRTLLYVDRHLLQDGSAPAFAMLRQRGLAPRAPERAFATPDHYVPTRQPQPRRRARSREARAWRRRCATTRAHAGIRIFGLDDRAPGHRARRRRPSRACRQPGMLIVCGDSHTSTHGALGALAFGIGASEVAHVLATQTIWQRRPKTLRITVDGALGAGVTREGRDPRDHRARSAPRAPRATRSSTRARRCARCRWKAASRCATCRSRRARAPA